MVKTNITTFSFLQKNRVFFYCCLLGVLLGGLALVLYPQGSLLLYFSEHRHPVIDIFFKYATKIGEEPTYLLFLFISLFIRFRYAILIPAVGVIVTIVAFLAKSFFQHPRPSVYYRELGLLDSISMSEGVSLLGGLTSFPSGHTMSAFALFSFVAFLFPKKGYVSCCFFLIALLVGISRVYLVQHFFKDIYLGAILGVVIGGILYIWQVRFLNEENRWWNRKLDKWFDG